MRNKFISVILIISAIVILGCIFHIIALKEKDNIELEVVDCSSNLALNDIKKLLNHNEKLAIPECESWILLSLEGKTKVSRIVIKTDNYDDISIVNTDGTGKKDWEEFDIRDIDKLEECAYIKLKFQSSNTLKGIEVFGTHLYPPYIDDNMDIIEASDNPNNPLYVYRIPLRKYMYILADDILGEGRYSLTQHQKIVKFMQYVAKYKVGMHSNNVEDYLTDWIKSEIGACGEFSGIVAALAYTQGIETRLLTMGNYPKGSGHACIEAKINGRWSFYDPTYMEFYTTDLDNENDPYLLSFEELCSGHGYDSNVHKVILNTDRFFSPVSYEFTGPDIYVKANPRGVVSPFVKLYYPIDIPDGDGFFAMANKFQGGQYLGAGEISNCWDVSINNLVVGQRYIMKIKSMGRGGEDFTNFKTMVIPQNCEIIQGKEKYWAIEPDTWEVVFEPFEPTVTLKVDHNAVGDKFKYVSIHSIYLDAV